MSAEVAYAREAEDRAKRAEAAIVAERIRADALQSRLESELRRAQEAAELLRQAEIQRRARGRLRRAWEAWRGRA